MGFGAGLVGLIIQNGFWFLAPFWGGLLFPIHRLFIFFRGGSLLGVAFCLVSDFSKVNFGVFTPKFSLFSSWGLTEPTMMLFLGARRMLVMFNLCSNAEADI